MSNAQRSTPLRFQPTTHRDHEIVPRVFKGKIQGYRIREAGSGALMATAETREVAIAMIDEVIDG